MTVTVWVEGHEHHDDGEDFWVGGPVSWYLESPGEDRMQQIGQLAVVDFREEHWEARGGGEHPHLGRVISIQTLHMRHASVPGTYRTFLPVPGTARLTSIETTVGRTDADPDGLLTPDEIFEGYIVKIELGPGQALQADA